MKYQQYLFLAIFMLIAPLITSIEAKSKKSPHAITYYIESWRRLGDAITTVSKTLYFAQTHHLPVYYQEFPYFDQFALSQDATLLSSEIRQQFSKVIPIQRHDDVAKHLASTEPILFECRFLSETPAVYTITREYPEFGKLIKTAFTPLMAIDPLPKPPAVITVALHVRKGGGFDKPLGSRQEYAPPSMPKGIYLKKNSPPGSHLDAWPIPWPAGIMFIEAVRRYCYKKTHYSDYIWPIKFPPDQYYIDQLKELTNLLPGKNLLVYLFTDDPDPESIMARYSAQLADHPRIIFSYRQKGNHHTKNVLEDLFAITQCDCLISASSSFATAAQILGNHQVLIFPIHAITLPDTIVINKVGVITMQNPDDPQKRKLAYKEITRKIK